LTVAGLRPKAAAISLLVQALATKLTTRCSAALTAGVVGASPIPPGVVLRSAMAAPSTAGNDLDVEIFTSVACKHLAFSFNVISVSRSIVVVITVQVLKADIFRFRFRHHKRGKQSLKVS
jgi:hypothetical protein